MDEAEFKIVASCMARNVCYWVPLLRYRLQRDTERAKREYAEHVARLP
jgi:hypothetical protein